MINQELKELFNNVSGLIDNALKMAGLDEGQGKLARVDLAEFLMYLSASDGKIEWSEASNISEYLGMDLPPEGINQFIRENNIYSTEFEQKVPLSFQILVDADNMLWDNGKRNTCAADILLKIYKMTGEELIKADDDIDDNEMQDYQIYIDMLTNYIMQNDKFKQQGGVYTGLQKNTGNSVDAPIKSGVAAPRKR